MDSLILSKKMLEFSVTLLPIFLRLLSAFFPLYAQIFCGNQETDRLTWKLTRKQVQGCHSSDTKKSVRLIV